MSAHQQVDLHNPFLAGSGWAVDQAIADRGETQVRKSRKRGLAKMFASAEERTLADRELFLHIFSTEKKRAERSGKEFMLVLLRSSQMPNMTPQIGSAIISAIRDTDVAGWYEKNEAALGVIFTELAEPDQSIATVILKRMTAAISNCVPAELAANMEISCHIFRDRATQVDSFETVLLSAEELLVPAHPVAQLSSAAAND